MSFQIQSQTPLQEPLQAPSLLQEIETLKIELYTMKHTLLNLSKTVNLLFSEINLIKSELKKNTKNDNIIKTRPMQRQMYD
jgi:hypothetical protein